MSLEATNDTAKVLVLLENKETCHTYTTRKKKNNFLFLLPENSFSSITVFSQQNQYLRTDSLHCAFLSWEDLFKQWIFLRSSDFLLVFTPRLFSNFISLTRSMSTLEQYYIILSTEKKKKKNYNRLSSPTVCISENILSSQPSSRSIMQKSPTHSRHLPKRI